jgi:hypothetical protein
LDYFFLTILVIKSCLSACGRLRIRLQLLHLTCDAVQLGVNFVARNFLLIQIDAESGGVNLLETVFDFGDSIGEVLGPFSFDLIYLCP